MPGAQWRKQVLARRHRRRRMTTKPCHDAESDLRSNKPGPVDVAREQWIEQAQYCVKQARP